MADNTKQALGELVHHFYRSNKNIDGNPHSSFIIEVVRWSGVKSEYIMLGELGGAGGAGGAIWMINFNFSSQIIHYI